MPINYNVQANIVDIRSDMPRVGDAYWVDSNIWYWITYTNASRADEPPQLYQTGFYPPYIQKARAVKAQLYRCELSFAELAHRIESTELEIFAKMNGLDKEKRKEFRHNYPEDRGKVTSEISIAWGQVKSMAVPLRTTIDEVTVDAALTRCCTQCLDGYDSLVVENLVKGSCVNVISDDGDFATVPGLTVFTANRNVIECATRAGKIVVRT